MTLNRKEPCTVPGTQLELKRTTYIWCEKEMDGKEAANKTVLQGSRWAGREATLARFWGRGTEAWARAAWVWLEAFGHHRPSENHASPSPGTAPCWLRGQYYWSVTCRVWVAGWTGGEQERATKFLGFVIFLKC